MKIKKAKPALCFTRIAIAILGIITLRNSIFLLNQKSKAPLPCHHRSITGKWGFAFVV